MRDITERRQAENIVRTRLTLLEFAVSHSLEELLRKTLDEICELTGGSIGFYGPASQKWVFRRTVIPSSLRVVRI